MTTPKKIIIAMPVEPAPARRRKAKRLTGEQYKAARTFAAGMTGYDEASPIWGKRLHEVLAMVVEALDAGDTVVAKAVVVELQKRTAANKVIGSIRS